MSERHRFSWEKPTRASRARDVGPRAASSTSGIDAPQAMVAASVLAVAAWAAWRLSSDRAKTPIAHDPEAPLPAPVPEPEPTPAPSPIPGGPGMNVHAGDRVIVSARFLKQALALDIEGEGALFVVSIALPSLPSVTASPVAPIPIPDGPLFPGPMIVPREEIVRVVPAQASNTIPASPAPAPGGSGLVMLADPLQIRTGKRYRARLQLEGMQASFATEPLVRGQFETLGFQNVRAWQDPSALPRDWPAVEKHPAGKGVWFVEGSWSGAAASIPRPPAVVRAWEG